MKKEKRYYSTPNYWDDFLKPKKEKIVVALVLFLIFVPVVYYDNGVRCITTPCDSQTLGSALFFFFSDNKVSYGISYIDFIAGIILSYLIACLGVYLFEKKRKK